MSLVWFDEEIHHKVRKYCEKFRPEKCPECGAKEFILVYEKDAREGSEVRKAYWLCDNCKRIIYIHLPDR